MFEKKIGANDIGSLMSKTNTDDIIKNIIEKEKSIIEIKNGAKK